MIFVFNCMFYQLLHVLCMLSVCYIVKFIALGITQIKQLKTQGKIQIQMRDGALWLAYGRLGLGMCLAC